VKESKFQSWFVRSLRQAGAQVLNTVPDQRGGKGWPDIYVAHSVWTGWTELKGPKTVVKIHQRQRIRALRDCDVWAAVLRIDDSGCVRQDIGEDAGLGHVLFEMSSKTSGADILLALNEME